MAHYQLAQDVDGAKVNGLAWHVRTGHLAVYGSEGVRFGLN